MFYRLQVEMKWFIELSNNPNIKELPNLNTDTISYLENIIKEIDPRVKGEYTVLVAKEKYSIDE